MQQETQHAARGTQHGKSKNRRNLQHLSALRH